MERPSTSGKVDQAALYIDEHDREVHRHVIDSLVAEIGMPLQELKSRYENILSELREDAFIQDYLPVLVVKRLKQEWRHQAHAVAENA